MTPDQLKIKNLYPDWNTFLEKQGAKKLIFNYSKLNNIYDIVKVRRITLIDLQEIYPFKDSYAGVLYFKDWINYLNDYSNINKKISGDDKIKTMTFQLYTKYKHFTLPDMQLILDRIMEDYYDKSKFYGSLDTQSILTCFRLYNEERVALIGKLNEDRDKVLKVKKKELWDQIKQEEYSKIIADKTFTGDDPFIEADRRTEKRINEIVGEIAI